MIDIKRGLDIPIGGPPRLDIRPAVDVRRVAVLGPDYVGMKPTMEVEVGATVKRGSLLFTDKKTPGVRYTSPAAGKVSAIHRGEKRALQSVVIDVAGNDQETFARTDRGKLAGLARDQVQDQLVQSGLWTALRTRPFGRVPALGSEPRSIFVQAMDTNPLAPDPAPLIERRRQDFEDGLTVLGRLTSGAVNVCHGPDQSYSFPAPVQCHTFAGPHPAGLPGTHIHFVDPVGASRTVWYLHYQDVMAIGHLFTQGELDARRVISVAGPMVDEPRYYETVLGASVTELTAGLVREDEELRAVSGSVLNGHHAAGDLGFLGRYHLQISVLREGRDRELLGWKMPGVGKFSVKRTFAASLLPRRFFNFTTSLEGSHRAIVPVGSYESVMPLDIQPTFLLRSLLSQDWEQAIELGLYELEEEDLGLCTFVCPGKNDYGPLLRELLTIVEKEA